MDSTVDISLGTFWRQQQLFKFCSKIAKITLHMCVALKWTVFCFQFVLFLISEWSLQSSKETFCLACFCFCLHFQHFPTGVFFLDTGIFSHLVWYHFPQTEQNNMRNALSSYGSFSKNDIRHLRYNGKRFVTSFLRLTIFVCCGSGVIVSFSNCTNRCFLFTFWL